MKLTKTCAKFLRKHGGTILAVAASVGVGLTAYETHKAAVKATTLVVMNKDEPMTKKEVVQECWKFYIPAAVLGGGTIACILGSNTLNKKQIASLSAAYMALGKTYQEYRRQVAERIGSEAEANILEKSKVEEPAEEDKQLLCYEPFSNRYFHATEAELYDAFYQVNRDFNLNGEVSINNLYSYLGLDYLPEKDDVGWCSDYMINKWEYFWIDFVANKQTTDDGLEVYQVYAFQPPISDYLDYEPDKER
jgi:hypothetical protein